MTNSWNNVCWIVLVVLFRSVWNEVWWPVDWWQKVAEVFFECWVVCNISSRSVLSAACSAAVCLISSQTPLAAANCDYLQEWPACCCKLVLKLFYCWLWTTWALPVLCYCVFSDGELSLPSCSVYLFLWDH